MTNMTALAGGQVVAARYELARPLAAGHDGATWLARDTQANRDVVLRFRTSGDVAGERIHAVVEHPTLLAPLATHSAGDETFDVFDYLPGGEIGRLRGRPWTLIARRLLPVIDALSQLHAAGWVHGDVKSANVLLDGDGLPRLVDLGSARRIGSTQPAGASPYSTSPERLDGAAAAAADDIYALGVLLYELVSGHPPFYPDVTPQRVHDEIPPPVAGRPDPPAAFRALVARCLAKSPADRPASMRVIHEELQQILQTAPIEPRCNRPHRVLRRGSHGRLPMRCPCSRNGGAPRARRPRRSRCAAKDSAAASWWAPWRWRSRRQASPFSSCRVSSTRTRPRPRRLLRQWSRRRQRSRSRISSGSQS